jgi:hypothetical protein
MLMLRGLIDRKGRTIMVSKEEGKCGENLPQVKKPAEPQARPGVNRFDPKRRDRMEDPRRIGPAPNTTRKPL